MSRSPATWILVAGLVLSRLLGLHVHACSGIESVPQAHEEPHVADLGLLFGESHQGDHADNQELEISAASVPAKLGSVLGSGLDLSTPPTERFQVAAATGWLTTRVPRGPPIANPPRPDFFKPAPRGPPSNSFA